MRCALSRAHGRRRRSRIWLPADRWARGRGLDGLLQPDGCGGLANGRCPPRPHPVGRKRKRSGWAPGPPAGPRGAGALELQEARDLVRPEVDLTGCHRGSPPPLPSGSGSSPTLELPLASPRSYSLPLATPHPSSPAIGHEFLVRHWLRPRGPAPSLAGLLVGLASLLFRLVLLLGSRSRRPASYGSRRIPAGRC